MKVIVVSWFFINLITLHQRNLSIKQENMFICFSLTYQLNTFPEPTQQTLPHQKELQVTTATQGDHCDHKELEEENRVRSTSTLPHGKLHHHREGSFLDCKTIPQWRNDCCLGLLGCLLP